MLVSFLIPTRNCFDWLGKCLRSIRDTASDYSQIECCLRIDDDDKDRIDLLSDIQHQFNIKPFIGPRAKGYGDSGRYYDEMLTIASGKWVWQFDDDAWLKGNTWQHQISRYRCDPVNGPALQAEIYRLGESGYRGGVIGLIVPAAWARKTPNQHPIDDFWYRRIEQQGWKIEKLRGVEWCHEGRCR